MRVFSKDLGLDFWFYIEEKKEAVQVKVFDLVQEVKVAPPAPKY